MEDPFAAVERLVPALRPQSDMVVVLAHLKQEDLDRLTKTAGKGIDLVIAGHNSYVMSTQPQNAQTRPFSVPDSAASIWGSPISRRAARTAAPRPRSRASCSR